MSKVTRIRKGAVSKIPTQNGDSFEIPNSSVGTAELQDLAVTRNKLSQGAVARQNVRTLTTTDSALETDDTLFVSAGASWVLTLYSAVGLSGRRLTIIRTDNSPANLITVDGAGAETINGAANYVLNLQFQRLSLLSDGTNWLIEQEIIPWVASAISNLSFSQASTSYTLLSNATRTVVGTGRPMTINFSMTGENQASGVMHSFRLYVDGVGTGPEVKHTAYNGATAGYAYCLPLTYQFTPSLGSHIYEIRFFTSSGSFGIVSGQYSFNVTEVRD